jgi:hypothetical protein
MTSIIPEGYEAYKVVRRDSNGYLCSLFLEDRSWKLTYDTGYTFTPSGLIVGTPAIWMFVFLTYEHAEAFFNTYHMDKGSEFEIWRVRVFEQDLPTPKLVLPPGQIARLGRAYWQCWWFDDNLLSSLKENGIPLIAAPLGTRLCSQLRFESRVR